MKDTTWNERLLAATAVILLGGAPLLGGCDDGPDDAGDIADSIGDAADDAADSIDDAIDDAGDAIDDATDGG